MPMTRHACSLLLPACVCLLALTGCGSDKTVTVTGKLVLPAQVKLAEGDSAEISFLPEGSGKAVLASAPSGDQSFTATKVPPGKYKVAVQLTPYQGSKGSEARAREYETLNKAFGPTTTKLTYEATSDSSQSITIDLVKGSITKS